uniref:28 kDa Metastriate family member n=1 Tax=Rhipicephalus zambeziensis TaxID=60191 RepID=A0A224Y9Z1_9ACAR
MFRLGVVLLCFVLQQCTGENSSKKDMDMQKIGDGLEVKVYVIYDTDEYSKQHKPRYDWQRPGIWYFLNLFDEVQEYFYSKNVMVMFSVIAVEKVADIWVRTNQSLDTNATLEKLQMTHSSNYSRPNETIVYLFTNRTLPIQSETATATLGTLCSPNVSAAIAVQQPGSKSYVSAVEATSLVFGASGSFNFTDEDIQKMNHTFSNCYIKPSRKNRRKRNKTAKTTSTATSLIE